MRVSKTRKNSPHDQQSSANQHTGQLYTDEFVGGLARAFDIKPEQIGPLKHFLNHEAEIYEASKQLVSRERQLVNVRDKLRGVADARDALAKSIDYLSHLERDRLWHSWWDNPARRKNSPGYADFVPPNEYADETAFRRNLEDFGRRLSVRLADLENVHDRGGHPKGMPLIVWAAQVRDFWERVLGRKFIYKKVFPFLTMAIQPLVPDVRDAALKTAVREIRKAIKVTYRMSPEFLAPESLQKPPRSKR